MSALLTGLVIRSTDDSGTRFARGAGNTPRSPVTVPAAVFVVGLVVLMFV